MSWFLSFVFIFFIGSIGGWILELIFRRVVYKVKINPGFLVGPYLPIYGFGLCTLTYSYLFFNKYNLSPIIIIILMGLFMTIIELIGGLAFLKAGEVKLWDYSKLWGNYKGIICPLFSFIWTLAGGFYYYVLAPYIIGSLKWFSTNLSFSFVLGVFFGIIVIDFAYSTNLLVKIRKYAKDNNIKVIYEDLKNTIREKQKIMNEKYNFILAFKQNNPLSQALEHYKKHINNNKD